MLRNKKFPDILQSFEDRRDGVLDFVKSVNPRIKFVFVCCSFMVLDLQYIRNAACSNAKYCTCCTVFWYPLLVRSTRVLLW